VNPTARARHITKQIESDSLPWQIDRLQLLKLRLLADDSPATTSNPEEDECPICHHELPSRELPNFEALRETHVTDCIQAHSRYGSPRTVPSERARLRWRHVEVACTLIKLPRKTVWTTRSARSVWRNSKSASPWVAGVSLPLPLQVHIGLVCQSPRPLPSPSTRWLWVLIAVCCNSI